MNVSIVIPTYNRNANLNQCLDSILIQSLLPVEIIIVDNSSEHILQAIIHQRENEFEDIGIKLCYFHNSQNSLTSARNLGSKQITGDIVLFLDDDVILDVEYVREICRVYETNPNTFGVQGYIQPENRGKLDRLHRIFFWFHLERNKCRVLHSVSATYPLDLDGVIPCEWLSGANHSYRRKILDEFEYDEVLLKYSEGEDLEYSYRVYCQYPGSLFITSNAKLVHKTSPAGRTLGKELVYMQEVYGLYLFFKLFEPNLKNFLIYFWSRIGRLVISLARAVIKRPTGAISELQHRLGAYILCLRCADEIRRGNLTFFNNTLS